MNPEPKDERLWCMHISGMDEVHAAPSRAAAQRMCKQYWDLLVLQYPFPHPYDPVTNFTVQEWPWSAEDHAADLAKTGDLK